MHFHQRLQASVQMDLMHCCTVVVATVAAAARGGGRLGKQHGRTRGQAIQIHRVALQPQQKVGVATGNDVTISNIAVNVISSTSSAYC